MNGRGAGACRRASDRRAWPPRFLPEPAPRQHARLARFGGRRPGKMRRVPAPSFVTEVLHAADAAGLDLAATGYAWARVAPTVAIVPAFGLRALPAAARGALGVALALAIAPAVAVHLHGGASSFPWPLLLLLEVVRGLPVALAAAIPLWGATMVGGVVDSLRGDSSQLTSPVVDGQTTSLGVLFSLLATSLFLAGGGAARVVAVLAGLDAGAAGALDLAPLPLLVAVVHQLAAGLEMAVALAAPLLVAAVIVEVGGALIARAAFSRSVPAAPRAGTRARLARRAGAGHRPASASSWRAGRWRRSRPDPVSVAPPRAGVPLLRERCGNPPSTRARTPSPSR